MVTEHSNTVYNCAGCGSPLAWRIGSAYSPPGWHHLNLALPCTGLEPVEVRLPLPSRDRVPA